MTEPRNYDYDLAERIILENFGEKLRRGEHIFISEEDSILYFRKSIKYANCGRVDLDTEPIPGSQESATVPRHMALKGFSCRVGIRLGQKYVELWFPRKRMI